MKQPAYFTSLRFRILLIVMVCWMVPTLALGVYMGSVFFKELETKTEEGLVSNAEYAHALVKQSVEHLIAMSKDATYDEQLTKATKSYRREEITETHFINTVRSYLDQQYSREKLITFTAYFPAESPEPFIEMKRGWELAGEFKRLFQRDLMHMGESLDTRCFFESDGEQLFLVRNIYGLENQRFIRYGMLVLGVDIDMVMAPLFAENQAWGDKVDIQLDNYAYPYRSAVNWNDVPDALTEVGEEMWYANKNDNRDYTLNTRVRVNTQEAFSQMHRFRQLLVILVLTIVPIGGLSMWFVHSRITKPIFLLLDASLRMREGEIGITVPVTGHDELGQLGVAFSEMSTQMKHLIDTRYKEEIALRDAKIEAMQSRINPHFINNALEMINWQARMDDNETIATMVEAMSVLLNASMEKSDVHLATLSKELEVAEAYSFFIKQRFGDRLTVNMDIDITLLECRMPRLVIQTLLENAVEHGIAPMGGGHIDLNASYAEPFMRIEVINNGKALSEEDKARIHNLLSTENLEQGHIGIRNVNQRLALIYEGRASFSIITGVNGVTVATVLIPVEAQSGQLGTRNHI